MFDGRLWPCSFERIASSGPVKAYLEEPAIRRLVEFFEKKGLSSLKAEDREEEWYEDWITFQSNHHLYASVLSPKRYSTRGHEFDVLKYARLLEVFAYYSPSHGYSLQVSFLGLFSIILGSNDGLKREAVAALEKGGLFALAVSEKEHGSDLLGNEFTVSAADQSDRGHIYKARGRKYYIGNSNCAALVSILAIASNQGNSQAPLSRRPKALALVAIRPAQTRAYKTVKKIRTLGVRTAFVGEFEVHDHLLSSDDFIAEGHEAWDAVFGAVTLGKFFLGFGSIGICEHALQEAVMHLRKRVLYHEPAIRMSHIRMNLAQAYARLSAMKIYAYRALDYVHVGDATDRRYIFFCAVQKAMVSTQGVKVMGTLSECIGAKGFEAETFFESALRDIQLIPGLESSVHINLGLAAQFAKEYFRRRRPATRGHRFSRGGAVSNEPKAVGSRTLGTIPAGENQYLTEPHRSRTREVSFRYFLEPYGPFMKLTNVRSFVRQARAFSKLMWLVSETPGNGKVNSDSGSPVVENTCFKMCVGRCTATIAYAQLIAENVRLHDVQPATVSVIFHLLVTDLCHTAIELAALPDMSQSVRGLARKMIAVPLTAAMDWDSVFAHVDA